MEQEKDEAGSFTRKARATPFLHPQALNPRPGVAPCEPSLGGLCPGGEGHKPTAAFSIWGSGSHP